MKRETLARLSTLYAIQLVVLVLASGWGVLRRIPWWHDLTWSPWLGISLMAGLLLSWSSNLLLESLSRWRQTHLDWFLHQFLYDIFGGLPLLSLVLLAGLSGLAEEAFFRGVLLKELGLVASSVVFGLLHTGDRRLAGPGLWSMGVGLGLAVLYQHTGNLTHCVAVHGASNLYSFWRLWKEGPPPSRA